ncbi:MAG TPA: N-6 DNA methylase, partial [Candidatus Kapabacteria bacterium]|nr:N-6 DNA methylase [Candidatus Kapabacteria bacterium]
RTRFLRDQVVLEELKATPDGGVNYIKGFYEAFKKYLIIGLTEQDFADLYSQTVTYGLFAARIRCVGEFHRENAVKFIPKSIGFLHDVFNFLSTDDSRRPKQLECIIDDIADVLASVNVNFILNEYFHEGKGDDPIVHFYETFLSEYDPTLRDLRGVYYTPEPIVSFIVKSLHSILKSYFDKPDGLADTDVKILDPAAGTLTFVAEAAKLALKAYIGKYGEGVKKRFVRDHLLKNYYAFELMMAPYAIGHLKMSYVLKEMGVDLVEQERFHLYLTNTLENDVIEQIDLPGMSTLAQESRLAGEIKEKTPILVIMGNPPYSGISINKGDWIKKKIETYKYVDGIHFKEKKHWLQDDYVKFIRFAQWKIDQNGEGVIGFITNHSYLDNQTFRGMRQSLMESFNEIYVLDLHGNITSKEKSPDGSKDEGVFDIRQGVAISLFIKTKSKKGCSIFHSEIWGTRDDKYEWLSKFDLSNVNWQKLSPTSPSYFFIPRAEKNREVYESFEKITDIFPTNVTGIVTARDRFVIDFNKDDLIRRLEMFRNQSFTDDYIRNAFNLKDTRGWILDKARKKLEKVVNL